MSGADLSNPAVKLQGVTKAFGHGTASIRALRGIDLQITPNQLIMLVGPSGCGKTTLLSVVCGVLDADHGQAEVFGTDWSGLSPAQKTARRAKLVGYVFQQFNLIPTLSAVDNVAVPLLIQGVKRRPSLHRASEALSRVGLGDRTGAFPAELSGGQQQRVAIARALVTRPPLLVCDEPTANLDSHSGQRILELIQAASRDQAHDGLPRCVIVVTHDPRLFHYADRIEQMEDGRLIGPISPEAHELKAVQHPQSRSP